MSGRPFRRLTVALPICSMVLLPTVVVRADGASDHFEAAHNHYEKWLRTSQSSELDSALTELAKAHKARPKEPIITQWIGFIKLKQGKYEEALPAFQETIRLSPDLPEPYINSGFANAQLGRFAEASAAYSGAIPRIKSYALAHREGNQLRSQMRRVYYDLGEVYFKQNRLPDALTAYEHAADLNTEKPKELTEQELALYNDADRRQRGLDEPKIQESIGGTLEAQGEPMEAAHAYERATLLESNNALYWKRQGLAYRAAGAKSEAGSDAAKDVWKQAGLAFGKAAELVPADYAAREYYAEALEEQGRSQDALTQFAQAAKDRATAQQSAATPSDTRYHNGLALAQLQRWPEAEDAFALAAQAEPKNPAIYEWLGYARLQQKTPEKYEAAVTAFKTADTLRPNQAETHLSLGRAYDALMRPEDAAAEFETAAKIAPNSSLTQYNLGSVYNRRSMFPEAAAAFQKAIMLDPNGNAYDPALANAGLGYSLHQIGLTPGQSARLEEAAAAQEKAVALNPALLESWTDLAYIYFDRAQDVESSVKSQSPIPANGTAQIGDAWRKAATALKEVVDRAPDTPKIHDVYAYALSKSNRSEDAISQFEKGVSLDEKPYEFLVTLAIDLDVAKRYGASEDVYRRAIAAFAAKKQGKNVNLIALLGHTQMEQGKYSDAETTYAKVIALTPDDLNAYVIRYTALQKLGRNDEGVTLLNRAMKVSESVPDSDKKKTLAASLQKSLAYQALMKGGEANLHYAAGLYKTVLTTFAKDAESYNGLGAIALKRSSPKEALPYLLKAVELDPHSDEAYNNLGAAYEGLDKLTLAVANYRKALAIDPNNAMAKQNLARYNALFQLRASRSK